MWDFWTHSNPNMVKDRSNGDIACNSFYRYTDDVHLVKELRVKNFLFVEEKTKIKNSYKK